MDYPKDGYIKYTQYWTECAPFNKNIIEDLIFWRDKCIKLGGIGYDKIHEVGVGNISHRKSKNTFYISGTQCGHIYPSNPNLFTLVENCDLQKNTLICTGPIKASSEAMTHFACYKASPSIKAIVHIHNKALWNKHLNKLGTTDKGVEYGTISMAKNLYELIKEGHKTIIMQSHEDGIFIVGKSLDDVGERYLKLIENI